MKRGVTWRVLAALGTAVALAAAVVDGRHGRIAARAAAPTATPTAVSATYPPYPAKLIVKTELRLKADLIARHLKKGPQLVFFGGSRSQRFDPVFAQKRTGLRAANIAMSCARPEAAWG